jgi:hypothetical protein
MATPYKRLCFLCVLFVSITTTFVYNTHNSRGGSRVLRRRRRRQQQPPPQQQQK